jgi:phage-related baseplate assembly protein
MPELPEIKFTEKDAGIIETEVITAYEAISGRKLYPGDPVRLFLLSIADLLVQQRSIIDFAGKMNLLSYAQDDYLDVLGDLLGVYRLYPQPSVVTLEFVLSEARQDVYTITKGTAATDGRLVWETTEAMDISAGDLSGTATAQCTTVGTEGNGRKPGQIDTLVEPMEYIDAVRNTTVSTGGSEEEGDENLRDRIRLAPSSFSVAGPAPAYRYWARSANQSIIDVTVISPTPGVIEIRPLMTGGELPDSDLLDQVADVLTSNDVRPLTDQVNVLAPTAFNYDITVDYWVSEADASQTTNIQAAVEDAVEIFAGWQKGAIGRDINPSELVRKMMEAGAKRVDVSSPIFVVLDKTEVALEYTVTVNYRGIEDA